MTALYTTLPSFVILLILLFSYPSSADIIPSPTVLIAPDLACNATLYPDFCKSILPHGKPSNILDYGRFSIRQSLSKSKQFMALIDKYLSRRSTLTTSAIRALEDCRLLAGLNMDFLASTIKTIGSRNTLGNSQAEDAQTFLSAILTNQQTCSDGLEVTSSAWSIRNELRKPNSDGNKLYSVSLALFNHGWVHKKKRGRFDLGGRKLLFSEKIVKDGRLNLRMSSKNQELFESVSGRKLLQDVDNVLVRDIVVVDPNGSGNFTTITDAVQAAPNNTVISDGYFVIYVVSGLYEENIMIDKNKKNLMMVGDGINQTVITGNRSVVDGWTTFNSATLAVVGQGFVGLNITFQNTAGAIKHQAVAVRNGADLSAFYSCSFEAYQDTLYTHSLRQFYRDCDIYGTIDFIFGNAAVVLQNCNLYARLPMKNQFNALTAQGRTDPNQNTGTSIHNCAIIAAPDLASSNGTTKTYLGRPWKEYSRTVYMQSLIDSLIEPVGWNRWNGDFAINTSYYAEFDNTGPGANTSNRVTWPGYHVINSTDAAQFTVSSFILGDEWLPDTGVPYETGLL